MAAPPTAVRAATAPVAEGLSAPEEAAAAAAAEAGMTVAEAAVFCLSFSKALALRSASALIAFKRFWLRTRTSTSTICQCVLQRARGFSRAAADGNGYF